MVGTDAAPTAVLDVLAYVIVTNDTDFSDVSVLRGSPPKVIWLRLGNCTTADVERTLRHGLIQISAFASDPTVSVLELI